VSKGPAPKSVKSEDWLQRRVELGDTQLLSIYGPEDQLLKALELTLPAVEVMARGEQLLLSGPADQVKKAEDLVYEMVRLMQAGAPISIQDLERSAKMLENSDGPRPAEVLSQSILSSRGKSIRPKTVGQKTYVDAIDENTIVFGIGPAGTGKTYLAMAKAVQALQRKEVSRIILTRPAVEAGERLGFLPGTLTDKIDPYLRPLFDALHEMLDPETVPKLMASGTIEVAPLAYMRGRTLNDSFIILDEAQNTTPEQMKMFLTRLGFNSKMVVTGDITQVDLPAGVSGLKTAESILTGVADMHFSYLSSADVVRHSLVSRIVEAYAIFDQKNQVRKQNQNGGKR
jgi:phosphate starvation-inducible PhoH-like protein